MQVSQPLLATDNDHHVHADLEGAARWGKRCFDAVVAAFLIALLAPLFLGVALAVKLHDGGPVLFRQTRLGRGGRHFRIAKFRTMVIDAEARLLVDPELFARYVRNDFKLDLVEDVRVNRLGRFLRASSLDELPQLLNVLRGDMSLVGPRPVVPEEIGGYGHLAYSYLGVRPGITGMWQVPGRSHVRFPERAELDRRYYEGRSLILDLKILLRTPVVVLRADGAY